MRRMLAGYRPQMDAETALAVFEHRLRSLEPGLRAAVVHAWDQRPRDPAKLETWLDDLIQAFDQIWGATASEFGAQYVIHSRAAHGYAEGQIKRSEALSTDRAQQIRREVVERLVVAGEKEAWRVLDRRVTGAVLDRARDTVALSAIAEGNGWYRIPEPGACWWCLMLASRGPVYSEETVLNTKKRTRYHAHCRCTAGEAIAGEPLAERAQACVDFYNNNGHFDRDDVESGLFTEVTGIASTSVEEANNKRLGRSKIPVGFIPQLDPAVPVGVQVAVPVEPATVITRGEVLVVTRGARRRIRYRGGHAAGLGYPNKTEFPAHWTEDDIIRAIDLTFASPQWSRLDGDRRRYRRDVHGVIVEASWFPDANGDPVIAHCYPVCGDGVFKNGPTGREPVPYNPADLTI